jgi:two-component system, NarL family, invasion response regulator UvrY
MNADISVLVVDDHAVVRSGCRQLLESWGGFRVREASGGAEALARAAEDRPDVVILDLNLPDMGGFEVLDGLLAGTGERPRVLIFTMHEESGHAKRAMSAGAHGFVTKSDEPDVIVEAVRRVAMGEIYISQPMAQKLVLSAMKQAEDPMERLSPRERETVSLLGRGKTIAEIAGTMGISYKTVANTLTQAKDKLRLSSTAELMRAGIAAELAQGPAAR